MTIRSRGRVLSAILATAFAGVVLLQAAQAPPAQAPAAAANATPAVTNVPLTVGHSLVLATAFDITRVAVTNPAIADATVVEAREILIDGKAEGTVSLIIWGGTQRAEYNLVVDAGVSPLQRELETLFPGEDLHASETPDVVFLTGHASSNAMMLRAGEIASAMAPKANIVNLVQAPGGPGSQQVMLQVRVAEVDRNAVRQLGTSLFTGGTGYKNVVASAGTEQFSQPSFTNYTASTTTTTTGTTGTTTPTPIASSSSATGGVTLADFLNLFVFSTKYDLGTVIEALQTKANFQSLAEPNLMAYNNQEASFLAGGEIPIPIVQGVSGQVTIQWREYGVRLTFKPTIAGDVIRLHVKPEVSSLDFADGISLNGFRVPALTTRRAETDVELRDGQSFVIGGLMNNTSQDTADAIPVLSQLPIIGNLFKSRATTKQGTELMVLVTPRLVRPLDPDEVPPLPTMPSAFLTPCGKMTCDAPTTPATAGSGSTGSKRGGG